MIQLIGFLSAFMDHLIHPPFCLREECICSRPELSFPKQLILFEDQCVEFGIPSCVPQDGMEASFSLSEFMKESRMSLETIMFVE